MKFRGHELNHEFLKGADAKTLKEVSALLREEIIANVSETGGHLASNLGIVELTVELIHRFDPLKNDIIFDVGHQTYAYKILTGRDLKNLRQYKGSAPISSRSESPCDKIDNGHSSTSLSIALGMSLAKKQSGDESYTICVIGDGSLPNGLAYEALNHIGLLEDTKLIIVLNDNDMSISKPSGSIGKRLQSLRTSRFYLRNVVNFKRLDQFKGTKWIYRSSRYVKNIIKKFIVQPNVFEAFCLDYTGPYNGNDIKEIQQAFNFVMRLANPIIVHFKTKKGLGYKFASEDSSGQWHGMPPFDIATGQRKTPAANHLTDVVAEKVYQILRADQKAFLICSAMQWGAHLSQCFTDFPERTVDVGIAEEHSITFAAGLALKGYHPIISIYSTFLQRGYDQVLHDICRQHLGVLFLIERAGLTGQDGSSHQGIYDIAFLESMPNTQIYHPSSRHEMIATLDRCEEFFALNQPTFVRISHESAKDLSLATLSYGHQTLLITYGQKGIELGQLVSADLDVCILEQIYPLESNILETAARYQKIVIYDAYGTENGFAASLLLAFNKQSLAVEVKIYALPNEFIPAGTIDELLHYLNRSPDQVRTLILHQ